MLKVLKYLKKTWVAVVCIIILLCIQATTDLNLPDYTSKIVNTGIQSGGIEIAVPEIISQQDMETLLLFVEDKDEILSNYSLIENANNVDAKYQEKLLNKYIEKNDLANTENIYLIKDITNEQKKN